MREFYFCLRSANATVWLLKKADRPTDRFKHLLHFIPVATFRCNITVCSFRVSLGPKLCYHSPQQNAGSALLDLLRKTSILDTNYAEFFHRCFFLWFTLDNFE